MTVRRTAARLLAAPTAAGVLVLASGGAAAAHVTVTPTTTEVGAYTVLTVSVPHGCDGSATTKVAIQIPKEILAVTATRNPYWDVVKQKEKLAQPVTDPHGTQITERDATVVYTAKTPLPDGDRDAFELSLKLPEEAGKTLAFPAIQTCQKGQTAWTEIAAAGQDPDKLEHPAPLVVLDAAAPAEGKADSTVGTAGLQNTAATETRSGDGGSNTLGVLGLITGLLGLLAGGAALVLVRRRA